MVTCKIGFWSRPVRRPPPSVLRRRIETVMRSVHSYRTKLESVDFDCLFSNNRLRDERTTSNWNVICPPPPSSASVNFIMRTSDPRCDSNNCDDCTKSDFVLGVSKSVFFSRVFGETSTYFARTTHRVT